MKRIIYTLCIPNLPSAEPTTHDGLCAEPSQTKLAPALFGLGQHPHNQMASTRHNIPFGYFGYHVSHGKPGPRVLHKRLHAKLPGLSVFVLSRLRG